MPGDASLSDSQYELFIRVLYSVTACIHFSPGRMNRGAVPWFCTILPGVAEGMAPESLDGDTSGGLAARNRIFSNYKK